MPMRTKFTRRRSFSLAMLRFLDRVTLYLGLAIATSACLATMADKPTDGKDSEGEKLATLVTDYFTIEYPVGYEADAENVKGFLQTAVDAMLKEFADHRPDELLRTADCKVRLYSKPNNKAGAGAVLIETGVSGSTYFAHLHLLAPSAHPPTARTKTDEPMDDSYIAKTLVHEYSTIILERLTRRKTEGWRLFSAPAWFVQGYEEHLALKNASEHSRTVTWPRYLDLLRANPNRVSMDFGIDVTDPYIDGAILLAFMHDVYGSERVQAVLVSSQPTFGAAMKEALGDNLPRFAEKFEAWKKSQGTAPPLGWDSLIGYSRDRV
jgi:hypothetical protein